MKYYCEHCSYETDKKANFIRHLNRKFKCNKNTQNVYVDDKNLSPECDNIAPYAKNIALECDNIALNTKNISLECDNIAPDAKTLSLDVSNKKFVSLRNLKMHQDLYCKGVDVLQCEICFKRFASYNGKYKHKRDVLCFPPPPPQPLESPPLEDPPSENPLIVQEPSSSTTISNIQNNQMTNSNNNNTINNIIQYNAFGDEGIEQLEEFLGEDAKIIERLKQVGKKKMYGIRDIQNDIFFNPKNPKGFSIIKPEKYGSSVRVRNSEGEFEYMEFDDVRDPMLNYIEKYINIYNKTRNKYNVKFRDPKERRILYTFLKIMNDDLDIYLNEDLKEELEIEDETKESDDEDENNKYKQFDKLSLDNIHVQTKKYFKCKKGEFVLKEKS